MILKRIFTRVPVPVDSLYGAIVAAARRERFYAAWHVPDTLDGRFDMIALHLFLVLERLANTGKDAEKLRQRLTDRFFLDMDRSLREMGVGDLSVGKKVRKMAESFYGRVAAYAAAGSESEALAAALRRNLFPENPAQDVVELVRWLNHTRSGLAQQSVRDLLTGEVLFP